MSKFNKLYEATIRRPDGEFVVNGLKRVSVRAKGRTTTTNSNDFGTFNNNNFEVVGWFATKNNMAYGWGIYKLDKHDIKWLKESGLKDLKGVMRTASDKGTSIAKFNLEKGTYAFVDNEHFENTDLIKFEKMSPYNRLLVDDIPNIKDLGTKIPQGY